MNTKSITALIFIFILVATIIPSATEIIEQDNDISSNVSEEYIFVDDDNILGPWQGTRNHPFQLIQEAIDFAQPNHVIYIFNGRYNQTIDVNKKITLIGQDKQSTLIDGVFQPIIISVHHEGVMIQNLTIQKSGGEQGNTGIFINASNILIKNCQFFQTRTAVKSSHQENITLINCLFHKNGEGIFLDHNIDCSIENCTFYQNGLGLNFNKSKKLVLTSSKAHTNGIGYFFIDSQEINITRCAAYNNNDNQGGFFIENCSDINYFDCIISHNGFGMKTSQSNNITVSHSTISYNTHAGILNTDGSDNINIQQCEITRNLRISIYSTQANITCIRNNIHTSLCGLFLEESYCDATANWWGSRFGPGIIQRKEQDNIKNIESIVDFLPWEKEKISGIGASWEINDFFEKPVSSTEDIRNFNFSDPDTDLDGVPDWWENRFGYDPMTKDDHHLLDPDMDGLNNIEECYTAAYGSDPFHQDIFLEFDWMECRTSPGETNKPSDEYIQKAIDIFATHNIALHIDVGELDGGEQIPYKVNFSFAELKDIYWDYFLDKDITNPRKGIFHYGLICDYGPANGFAVIGWDSMDSFCICAQTLQDGHEVSYPRQRFIIGSSIHELGHNLGLTVDDHGGNDNKIATLIGTIEWLRYLTYPSCMNYFYTYLILGFSDGSHGPGDFDDWGHMDLSFFKNTHFILPEQYR